VEATRAHCSASNCSCSTTETSAGVTAVANTHSPFNKSCGCQCQEASRAYCAASNCSCSFSIASQTGNAVTHSPFGYDCGNLRRACEQIVPCGTSMRTFVSARAVALHGTCMHVDTNFRITYHKECHVYHLPQTRPCVSQDAIAAPPHMPGVLRQIALVSLYVKECPNFLSL
jgi:hypothetical protein